MDGRPRVGGKSGLVGRRLRRANFVDHVGDVAGPDGMQALVSDGHDAYRMSGELQNLARHNTHATTRAAARSARRLRVLLMVAAFVAIAAAAVAVAGVTGYVEASRVESVLAIGVSVVAMAAYFIISARGRRKNAWY